MGTPIKWKTYSLAPTPEGEEHPNVVEDVLERFEVKDWHIQALHAGWLPKQKPMTDEEIWRVVNEHPSHRFELARAIEKAHGFE